MKLSGSYDLNIKKEEVWKNLNDPNVLMKCIPGCESFDKVDEYTFKASATNQIGPMNATFAGKIILSNIKENESYTLSGEGSSSVGFANGNADVKLLEKDGSTNLNYIVNISVGRKIAQLGSRLIDGVSKKMSDYFFGRFADLVDPLKSKKNTDGKIIKDKRVNEIKSNFLNNYIYLALVVLILLIVVIFYFF